MNEYCLFLVKKIYWLCPS